MTSNQNNYEVLIAGAGPSGCASAIILASEGYRVAIVDEIKPGFKIGESLPSAAIRLLKRIGINELSEILNTSQYHSCAANVSAWGSEKWEYMDALKNPEGGGWHLVRESFDDALRKMALKKGVTFFKGKIGRVKENQSEACKYQIKFKDQDESLPDSLGSNWLIDATGRSSVIIKQMGIDRKSHFDQLAAICWLRPNPNDKDQTTRIKSIEAGWLYSAQLPDGCRVLAFYGLPDQVAEMIRKPSLFFKVINETDIISNNIFEKDLAVPLQATKAGLSKADSAIGKNWLAVGDAALALDPLSSQGMFFALYSGIRGAETIIKSGLPANDINYLNTQYQDKIDRVFHANQKSRQYHYTSELRFTKKNFWARWFREA